MKVHIAIGPASSAAVVPVPRSAATILRQPLAGRIDQPTIPPTVPTSMGCST